MLGEDDALLRQAARDVSRLLDATSWARQVVLNFKDPTQALVLDFDHAKTAAVGMSAAGAANSLRWNLYGPVAVKWVAGDREYDLRVFDSSARTMTRVGCSTFPSTPERTRLSRSRAWPVSRWKAKGRNYRKNRQRAAFLTVHASGASVDQTVQRIKGVLSRVNLPPGYAFDLDRGVLELKESFSTLALALGLSVFLIYIVLASSMESLACPFMVLSILPTSLAFPMIAFFVHGQPLRIPALVGLIMLCGMAVNNSILIANEIRARGGDGRRVIMAIRKRLRPLLVSSGMTVVGTLPLLFAYGGGGDFMAIDRLRGLSGHSRLARLDVLLLPALAAAFPRAFKSFRIAATERSHR